MLTCLSLLLFLITSVSGDHCTGNLEWDPDASVCIPTCTAHFYPDGELCPNKTVGRCACPDGLIKLEDTQDQCVEAEDERCQAANKKYMDNPSIQFKFSKEPEDLVLNVGDTATLTCLVSSEYTIQYIWYKLKELPEGDNTAEKNLHITGTSELLFMNVTAEEAGYYQCKAVADTNFLMISSVGRVRVMHFTTGNKVVSVERVVLNELLFTMECAPFTADPQPTIIWYHDGSMLDYTNINYFVNKNEASKNFGTLHIANVKEEHKGEYICKGFSPVLGLIIELAERTLTITGSQNTVNGAPSVLEDANFGSFMMTGGTGTLYCAGYGYPNPTITWAKVTEIGQEQPQIAGCTESMCVQEAGRKLIVYQLDANGFGDYQCTVKNSYGDKTKVLSLTKAPLSYDIIFDSISPPVTIQPNRYTSFTLTCVVDTSTDGANPYMGWYQNTLGISDKGNRITINTDFKDGKHTQELVFDYPTNEDHGVFQCLAYNSKRFKQITTDVFIYMSKEVEYSNGDSEFAAGMYDPDSPKEYKYFSELKTAPEAEAVCQEWQSDAHLTTILDYQESDHLFKIIMANKNFTNDSRAWIGLTDEMREGIWLWLSGEISDKFSFWWINNPDNSGSDKDYAYMDAAKSGHWLDADNTLKMPFICKHYNGNCTDLENQSTIEFLGYTKQQMAGRISIYDTASIVCDKADAELTCAPSGKWVLSGSSSCSALEAITNRNNNSGMSYSYSIQTTLLILAYLLT